MAILTPKHKETLAKRFGLTFEAVRRSHLIPRLLAAEAERDRLSKVAETILARARAYRTAARTVSGSARLDWRFREYEVRRALARIRGQRTLLRQDIEVLKLRLVEQGRTAAGANVDTTATTITSANEHDRKLRALFAFDRPDEENT